VLVTGALSLGAPVFGADPSPAGSGRSRAGEISFMISGDPAELAAYQTLVAAFEQANPEIQVDVVHIPDEGDYLERFGLDLAASTPADVVLLNYRRQATFANRGALQPLDPYIAASDVIAEDDFFAQAIDPFHWQGQLMCVPQNASSLVVYYNKDLFDEAGLADPAEGWTWDDFLAAATTLTRDLDGDGTTDQYGLGTAASLIRVAPFIWQNGGEVVDNPQAPGRLAFDSPATREAIQWFVDLQVTHHVVPDATAEEAEDSESRFVNGRNAMFLQSRRPTPGFREITEFDWDVAGLPQNVEPASILHSDGYCMPADGDNKDAAWKLIEFANSVEGQTTIATTGRTVPSLPEVATSPTFLDPTAKPANSQVWLDAMPTLHGAPVMDGWIDVEEIVDAELERAYYGDQTVDDAIANSIQRTAPFFTGGEG
jgi:multiple sugar transport system substrate-binding protein